MTISKFYADQNREERIKTTMESVENALEQKGESLRNIATYIVDMELRSEKNGNREHFSEPGCSPEPETDFKRVCNELVNHPHMFEIGSEAVFSYLSALVTIKSWNK